MCGKWAEESKVHLCTLCVGWEDTQFRQICLTQKKDSPTVLSDLVVLHWPDGFVKG